MIAHEIIGDDMQAVIISMTQGDVIRAEAGAMMYMTDGIDMDAKMEGGFLGAGFFGGEGFILQKLTGNGQTFIHSGGTIVEMTLGAGEHLRVDTGCLVAFDESVGYDIVRVGGIKTSLFGGEGLFFASMTGPGRVWLQTLPFSRLADRIHSAYRGDREDVKRDFGGLLGKVGGIIGGDD